MGRPPVPDAEQKRIEQLWAEKPSQTAKLVWLSDDKKYSPRTYQNILARAKKKARPVPVDHELIPWQEGWPKDPAEISCLFKLRHSALVVEGDVGVDKRLAEWALKLRCLFSEAWEGSYQHLITADGYAQRHRAAETLNEPAYTADLDGQVMYRTWESPDHFKAWRTAMDQGLVPRLSGSSNSDDEEAIAPGAYESHLEVLLEYRIFLQKTLASAESDETRGQALEAEEALDKHVYKLFEESPAAWKAFLRMDERQHPDLKENE